MAEVLAPPEAPEEVDVLILGAGPVGMTLALALAGSALKVQLVDRRLVSRQQSDPRALALSYGARQLLEPLGAWPEKAATPITEIHVSQHGFGRTLMQREDYGLPALGYVARYGDLAATLAGALAGKSAVAEETEVAAITPLPEVVEVTLQHGQTAWRLRTRVLVHAEGSSDDRQASRIRDYRQHAVVAEVRTAPDHGGRAWERFTADGPLALLPLGEAYAVVFTVPPEKADHLMALPDAAFLAALQAQFGHRLTFTATGPRARFPLALRLRRDVARGREIWIGNTAQTLHPVSGQGFNLGLRDACQLAEHLLAQADPGNPAALARHAARRRLDRLGGAAFTDGIVRLFSNDLPPLRIARGLGLFALDLFPPARHFVTRRMIWGARAWP
ncbi:MAG: FAD-dependent monooxygenase [Betaproteobacteria bacterium]